MDGKREVLAVEAFLSETTDSWKAFFDKLKMRGVKRIALLISDAHKGIQKSFKESFIGGMRQRCKVHFMRNILAHVPHRAKKRFASKFKQIWLQENKREAKMEYTEDWAIERSYIHPQKLQEILDKYEDQVKAA